MVLLDTSYLIDYMRGKEEAKKLYEKLSEKGEEFHVPSIAIMEIANGAYGKNKKDDEIGQIKEFLASFSILSFDQESAWKAGEIEAFLGRKGEIIEPEDIMIGAIALQNGEILVTRNAKHFDRIEGLALEKY